MPITKIIYFSAASRRSYPFDLMHEGGMLTATCPQPNGGINTRARDWNELEYMLGDAVATWEDSAPPADPKWAPQSKPLRVRVVIEAAPSDDDGPDGPPILREYVMDHDDPKQRSVLGQQCRNAFLANQAVLTYPED